MTIATLASVRRAGNPGRERDDFYRTPAESTLALLAVETLPPRIWEPACGDGAISEILVGRGHQVVSTDLVDRGYGLPRRDFLMERELLAPAIITNPPFKIADEFVLHALALGADFVAIFQRMAWLEGRARHATLWSRHPPVRVWQFSGRQTLWRGDDPGARSTGGAVAFGWFIFQRGYSGPPALGWLT